MEKGFEIELTDGQIKTLHREDYMVVTLDGIEYAICYLGESEGGVDVRAFYVLKDESGDIGLEEVTNPLHALRVWDWAMEEWEKDQEAEWERQHQKNWRRY